MDQPARSRSLSLKLILTSALLVVGVVALFGTINAYTTGKTWDEQAALLSDLYTRSILNRGRVQTADLVQASRGPILQSDFATLQTFVPEVVKDDPEMTYAFVADKDGLLLAHSDKARDGKALAEGVDREMVAAKEFATRRVDDKKLYLFARPVVQDGQRVGAVVIAFGLGVLDAELKKIESEKEAAKTASVVRTAAVGLGFVLLGIAVAIFQSLRITRPLKLLAWRADQIARGDLEARVEPLGDDEIGVLAANFNYMADHLVVLLRETAQKAILEKELEVARTIQDTLVPPPELVDRGPVKLAGWFQPASQCGGDWWTVHDLDGGKLLVVIGDVTGHGVPAAMITAAAKGACDTVRAVTGGKFTAAYLLEMLNRAIFESAKRRFVMTCFASIIDPAARTITYANAGHNFPYLFRAGADGEEFQVLMARGNRLGDVAESAYAEGTAPLRPGDTLVWYTDGIVECESDRGEQFGEKRFRAAIKRAAGLGPEEMRAEVVATAQQFFGEQPRKDDITLVFGRVFE